MTTDIKSNDIETLIGLFDGGNWDELRISSQHFQLSLSKKQPLSRGAYPAPALRSANEQTIEQVTAPAKVAHAVAPAVKLVPPEPVASAENLVTVRASSLGTFYQSPKPGAQPYVQVGQQVEPETELCVVEVMKLFTVVRAGTRGIIKQVLVSDGQMVEFDQPLFLIESIE